MGREWFACFGWLVRVVISVLVRWEFWIQRQLLAKTRLGTIWLY